jgi:uncharacterized membrane protein
MVVSGHSGCHGGGCGDSNFRGRDSNFRQTFVVATVMFVVVAVMVVVMMEVMVHLQHSSRSNLAGLWILR